MNYNYFNQYNADFMNPNLSYNMNIGIVPSYYNPSMPIKSSSNGNNPNANEILFTGGFPINEVKQRKKITRGQLKLLEKTYLETNKPNLSLRKLLATKLNMTPRSVQIWFQNKRAKDKLKNNNSINTNIDINNDDDKKDLNDIKEEIKPVEEESKNVELKENEAESENTKPKPSPAKKCPAPLKIHDSNSNPMLFNNYQISSGPTIPLVSQSEMNMVCITPQQENVSFDNNITTATTIKSENGLPQFIAPMCLTPLSAGFPSIFPQDNDVGFRRNSFPLEAQMKNNQFNMGMNSSYIMGLPLSTNIRSTSMNSDGIGNIMMNNCSLPLESYNSINPYSFQNDVSLNYPSQFNLNDINFNNLDPSNNFYY